MDENIYALDRYLARREEQRDQLADMLQTAVNALCEIYAGSDDPWSVARAALLEIGR